MDEEHIECVKLMLEMDSYEEAAKFLTDVMSNFIPLVGMLNEFQNKDKVSYEEFKNYIRRILEMQGVKIWEYLYIAIYIFQKQVQYFHWVQKMENILTVKIW